MSPVSLAIGFPHRNDKKDVSIKFADVWCDIELLYIFGECWFYSSK